MHKSKIEVMFEILGGLILFAGALGLIALMFLMTLGASRGGKVPRETADAAANAPGLFTDLRSVDRFTWSPGDHGCMAGNAAAFVYDGFDRCGNAVRVTVCCDRGIWANSASTCRYAGHARTRLVSAPEQCAPKPPDPPKP